MYALSARYWWAGLLLLALISLKLNTWGLSWGMPSVVSWAPDTIAGSRTLFTVDKWPDRWPGHYPPLHFLVNQAAYWPVLSHWQDNGELAWDQSTGQPRLAPPMAAKIGLLVMISRVLTVLMSTGAVVVLALVARDLFGDPLSGLLAGLTLATCAEWVFFSHLGNLDVPHSFWLVLSLYAYVRACQTDRARWYVLLGLFAAFSTCTKDAVAGAYVGVAVMLAATRVIKHRGAGQPLPRALLAAVHPKMLFALAAFLFPYVTIQGIWANPDGYISRLGFYLGGSGVSEFNQAYQGQLWLAIESLAEAARGLGWPLLALMFAAAVYGLLRRSRQALLMILPALGYYLIVPANIHFVYARMLFPVYICLAVLVGGLCADWLRYRQLPAVIRIGSVALVFLSCVGYCAAVDLEMLNDTRARAERWLIRNVDTSHPLGVFSPPQYLPRFSPDALHAVPLEMSPQTFASPGPAYLLLTSHNYDAFNQNQQQCLTRLLAGQSGFQVIASFSKQYLWPQRRWYALAGWGTRGAGKSSPDITVLRRQ